MVVAMLSLLTSSTHANPVAGKGTDAEEANNSAGAVANPIRTVCPSFTGEFILQLRDAVSYEHPEE